MTRAQVFADTAWEDFVLSAAAIAPALADAGGVGVGATVLRAVRATREVTGSNTNLGIVLLLAPLACAAARPGLLRENLRRVLRELDVADAEAAFAAIRLAAPGGLGDAAEQDVRAAPTVGLREAMALAAERDTVAREYVSDFAVTFEVTLPALRAARERWGSWTDAALECYLHTLAAVPDTLIARKRGPDAAREVSRGASDVLAAGPPGSLERDTALAAFDARLREPTHALNPGTTADLVAAALFVALLEGPPTGERR